MSFLTNILYWISTSLLIPVIVILLISLIAALLMLGGFYGLYMNRLKFKQEKKHILERLKKEDVQVVGFDNK
ncbi:MotA/TolQ/ExbB proton channel family protein, partial [bacterium]|nr:MotA/TolQ/ExbB proton channel family protein [bacterium]